MGATWTRQVLRDLPDVDEFANDANRIGAMISGRGNLPLDINDITLMELEDVEEAYEASRSVGRKRVIILDYGGTLISREKMMLTFKQDFLGTTRRAPSAKVIEYLRVISSDPLNLVFVVSGAPR